MGSQLTRSIHTDPKFPEWFCAQVHPDLKATDQRCITWIGDGIKHCSDVLTSFLTWDRRLYASFKSGLSSQQEELPTKFVLNPYFVGTNFKECNSFLQHVEKAREKNELIAGQTYEVITALLLYGIFMLLLGFVCVGFMRCAYIYRKWKFSTSIEQFHSTEVALSNYHPKKRSYVKKTTKRFQSKCSINATDPKLLNAPDLTQRIRVRLPSLEHPLCLTLSRSFSTRTPTMEQVREVMRDNLKVMHVTFALRSTSDWKDREYADKMIQQFKSGKIPIAKHPTKLQTPEEATHAKLLCGKKYQLVFGKKSHRAHF